MMQTDIAKYAMWLFDRTVEPREQLPALYDLLRRKNPVGSQSLSFREFEAMFHRWHRQRGRCVGNADSLGYNNAESEPLPQSIGDETGHAELAGASEMLSPDVAPISDYHVVTEMLIERLVTAVKEYLDDGWTPIGGIARSSTGAPYWAQALIKRQVN